MANTQTSQAPRPTQVHATPVARALCSPSPWAAKPNETTKTPPRTTRTAYLRARALVGMDDVMVAAQPPAARWPGPVRAVQWAQRSTSETTAGDDVTATGRSRADEPGGQDRHCCRPRSCCRRARGCANVKGQDFYADNCFSFLRHTHDGRIALPSRSYSGVAKFELEDLGVPALRNCFRLHGPRWRTRGCRSPHYGCWAPTDEQRRQRRLVPEPQRSSGAGRH